MTTYTTDIRFELAAAGSAGSGVHAVKPSMVSIVDVVNSFDALARSCAP